VLDVVQAVHRAAAEQRIGHHGGCGATSPYERRVVEQLCAVGAAHDDNPLPAQASRPDVAVDAVPERPQAAVPLGGE
jgi:hypothetical protein